MKLLITFKYYTFNCFLLPWKSNYFLIGSKVAAQKVNTKGEDVVALLS